MVGAFLAICFGIGLSTIVSGVVWYVREVPRDALTLPAEDTTFGNLLSVTPHNALITARFVPLTSLDDVLTNERIVASVPETVSTTDSSDDTSSVGSLSRCVLGRYTPPAYPALLSGVSLR
jgi:hypothetical protein